MDAVSARLAFLLETVALEAEHLQATDQRIAARSLRNRMLHEYIRKPGLLAEAVNQAHEAVPMLVDFVAGRTAARPLRERLRMVLLDTSVFSEVLRPRPSPAVIGRLP